LAGSISTHCCRCQMGLELFFSFPSQKLPWHLTNYVQGSLPESASLRTHVASSKILCISSSATTKTDLKHLKRKAKWWTVSQFSSILSFSYEPIGQFSVCECLTQTARNYWLESLKRNPLCHTARLVAWFPSRYAGF